MRKWQRMSIAVPLICLLGFYPLLAPPAHRIDKDHFELIQNGMTLAEIESIFGQPPGSYDWAVAEDGGVRLWDVATGLKLGTSTSYNTVVIDTSSSDTLWADAAAITLPNRPKTKYVTTVYFASHITINTMSWTSRHGTCTIWFDDDLRVSGKSGWGESRVEPPWVKWWKKWFGE